MGKTATRVITVEYLEPSMSRHLLCKFPDGSAYDFDYAQSGIWSPLVPRGGGGGGAFASCPFPGGRRLFSEGSYGKVSPQEKKAKGKQNLSKLEGKIRKKAPKKGGASGKKKKRTLGFFAGSSASPTPKKGWGKILKSVARRFTKKRRSLQLMPPTL